MTAARTAGARALAVALVAATGCTGVGFGKIIPGADGRYRAGRQFAVRDGWMGPLGAPAEQVGTGRTGLLVGGRLGLGSLAARDESRDGGGFDVRVEVLRHVLPRLAVGGSVGWGLASAGTDDTGRISRRGFALAAMATARPVGPLMLRAGVVAEPGTSTVDGLDSDGTALGVDTAAGVAIDLRGSHFVLLLGWRHTGVDAETPTGPTRLTSDLYLFDGWWAF